MKSVKRIIKIAVGIFFVILGVIGLFLPILQGVLFIGIGLAILSTESRRLRAMFHKLKERFPEKLRSVRAGGGKAGAKCQKEAGDGPEGMMNGVPGEESGTTTGTESTTRSEEIANKEPTGTEGTTLETEGGDPKGT